jgi:N-ethylmaleimide reductase
VATFSHAVDVVNAAGLAYLHMVEGQTGGSRELAAGQDLAALRARFSGAYIANNGFTRELAMEAVASGSADLVAFGRLFIANPDLVERLRADTALNTPDTATFYGGGAAGYTDYPVLQDAVA